MSTVVGRTRIKRIRAAIEPEVLQSRRRPPRARRIAMYIIAAGAALAVAIPVVLWTRYRITYVVSRNALVKGSITNVGAQLSGVVTSVEVDAGQQVQAGQILARFEDHQLQATLQRAQSRLEKATRELEVERLAIEHERRRLGSLVKEASARLSAAKAQVEAAHSQADDARTRHELRQTLAQEGVIATEEVRAAETVRRTADAMGATAEADQQAAAAARDLAQVESEGLTVRQEHIFVLESDIAAFRAELALAEADLKAALIRAPADGWVVRRIAEPGGSVVVGQPIVALWIGKGVWVEAWIDEDDLGKVAAGSLARVTLKSYPGRVFSGFVETIGVSTDYELPDTAVPQPRNSRMRAEPVVCARIRLDEPEGLFPGLSAVVGIRKK